MREIVTCFDKAFDDLHKRSVILVEELSDTRLYHSNTGNRRSSGELILRSAGAVEQMANGITTRLWDDPFEWTLPEQLRTVEDVLEYLETVASTRKKAFEFIRTDNELYARLPAPVELTPLFAVLLNTLINAELLLAEAYHVAKKDA